MLAHCRGVALAVPVLVLGVVGGGHAVELNPAALIYQKPDQIKWNAPSAARRNPGSTSSATDG